MASSVFSSLLSDPVFRTYGICAAVLAAKMMVVSFNVSRLRFKYSVFKYPEDYINGRKERPEHSKEADAAIQRAYGLHTNDMENIYVFYTIGLLYAVTSPSPAFAQGLLWTYTGARIIHTISYLASKQPWRAISYLVNQGAQGVMLYHILRTFINH